jgi:hypothetical protein
MKLASQGSIHGILVVTFRSGVRMQDRNKVPGGNYLDFQRVFIYSPVTRHEFTSSSSTMYMYVLVAITAGN